MDAESSTRQLAHLALWVSFYTILFYTARPPQPYRRASNSHRLQQRGVTCQLLVSPSWKGLGRVTGSSPESLATPPVPLSHLYVMEEHTDWKVN